MKIAMWSGPRNLSTAMMYAFAQRPDCVVWDEPLYAAYLTSTGLDHPMRDQVIAGGQVDPASVISACTGSHPGGKPVFYQKHMTQHMTPDVPRDWLAQVTNVFLIRHPARVIASYAAKRENPTLEDIGFVQQYQLFEHALSLGQSPIVVDSADIREDPETMLRRLCAALDLPFDPAMLHWPRGPKSYDGAWAPHWYGAVWNSTTFAGAEGPLPEVPETLRGVAQAALPFYQRMAARKLTAYS